VQHVPKNTYMCTGCTADSQQQQLTDWKIVKQQIVPENFRLFCSPPVASSTYTVLDLLPNISPGFLCSASRIKSVIALNPSQRYSLSKTLCFARNKASTALEYRALSITSLPREARLCKATQRHSIEMHSIRA
jgi:hypothetical protein